MATRLELHEQLCKILATRNVYFQPPESIKINYPAIVYAFDNISKKHADDGVYICHKRYTVTLIDPNPDSKFVDKILALPFCEYRRFYKTNNLNHYQFSLYF